MVELNLTYDDVQIVPCYSEIEHRKECKLFTRISKLYTLKTPIVSAPMDTVTNGDMALELSKLGGLGFIHRFQSIQEQIENVRILLKNKVELIGAAVGVTGDYFERVQELISNGVKIILIDVANGHNIVCKRAISELKKIIPEHVNLIGGNVCTIQGALDMVYWGIDGLRVGIGNGSLCETRIRTGVGIPQVSALMNIVSKVNIPIIADGGITTPGDACKALGVGASTVMIGSLFAGTKESEGVLKRIGNFSDEQLYKEYRGSASLSAKMDRGENCTYIEGNSKIIRYKGPVKRIFNDILDGIRSSMSYVGAKNLIEFKNFVELVRVTQNGFHEAYPHLFWRNQ